MIEGFVQAQSTILSGHLVETTNLRNIFLYNHSFNNFCEKIIRDVIEVV